MKELSDNDFSTLDEKLGDLIGIWGFDWTSDEKTEQFYLLRDQVESFVLKYSDKYEEVKWLEKN